MTPPTSTTWQLGTQRPAQRPLHHFVVPLARSLRFREGLRLFHHFVVPLLRLTGEDFGYLAPKTAFTSSRKAVWLAGRL